MVKRPVRAPAPTVRAGNISGDVAVVFELVEVPRDRSDAILTDKAGQPVTPAPQPRLSHESTVQLVGANLQITKDEVLGSC